MRLINPAKRYRHLARYGEIISVLARYGFGDLLASLRVHRFIKAGKRVLRIKPGEELASVSRWDRIRMALEELGPTFIKLGQFASNRPDILPLDLVVSLEKLQDTVPPFPQSEAVARIEKELGKPVGELFTRFDEQPFASASISQVYRARLKNGDDVVVKVQRPRLEETVQVDIEIMRDLAQLLEKYLQELRVLSLEQLVDEFAGAIHKELDFTSEARHFETFAANFHGDPEVHIPKVYREFTTRRIITTEFINGRSPAAAPGRCSSRYLFTDFSMPTRMRVTSSSWKAM
jgi:ubiquinone biosynthesis protein